MGLLEVIWPSPLTQTGCPGLCPYMKYCFCYIQMEFPLKQFVYLVSSGICAFLQESNFIFAPAFSYWNTIIKSLLNYYVLF